MKRVMLLDVYGLVYRAFFALPPLTTSRGIAINAAYGFALMVNKLIADEKPTHLLACFDKGVPPERRERFPDYKAQRTAMPDELRPQFGIVRRLLATWRVPILELEGQEADDVLATLTRQVREQGEEALVVTGDLDLLQVVEPHVTALVTRRGITELSRYDEAAVRERFGLEPRQLADYRGLKGDPSDNLPGIPGVGEKTATKLIQTAGTLDALLARPALAGTAKLQGLVETYGEQARACRDVSVLDRQLPVQLDWEGCVYSEPDPDELYKLYHELEFKTLLAKMPEPKDMAEFVADETLAGTWTAVSVPEGGDLADVRAVAYRDGWIGVSAREGEGVEFPLAALEQPGVREALARATIVYDRKSFQRLTGTALEADDPMLAAHLLDPSRHFQQPEDAAAQFLEKRLPPRAAARAAAALALMDVLPERLRERNQWDLYRDVELPLASILAGMERAGVAVDPERLRSISEEIDQAVERTQAEIHGLAGESFNIGSPQQLGAILFEKLQLPGGKRNKTGWGTGVEVLQGLAGEHPICAQILEYRELTKLKNTYVDVIPRLVESDGRLRTQFNQTVTATGRLSSANPNLQNIPVRGQLGRRVRRAFVAPPGRLLLAADYDQIELRLMAHLSGDAAMRAAFQEGQDIHDFTARQIFHVDVVSSQQRRIAKSVNFGLLYGMSDFGLAQRLEISRAQAKEMTTAYFARFPSVKAYIKQSLEDGRLNGYVSTLLGRRRYMPALRSSNYLQRSAAEREATNAPIQGSAADLMKLAMVRIDRQLKGLDAQMLLQIHDELIFEVAEDQVHRLAEIVREQMETAFALAVPIRVSLQAGPDWYEAGQRGEIPPLESGTQQVRPL